MANFHSRNGGASAFCVDRIAWNVHCPNQPSRALAHAEKLGGTGGLIAVDKMEMWRCHLIPANVSRPCPRGREVRNRKFTNEVAAS